MSTKRAALAVGLFAVLAVAATVVGVAFSNRGIGAGPDTYRLRALFDDVTGIAPGTKVTIAGVRVGEVHDLELKGQRVEVGLRLLRKIKVYRGTSAPDGSVRNGAVLTRLQASLLGDYYLELAPGMAGQVLKDGDEIALVITATALQQTLQKMDRAADVVPKIDQIASDVAKITHNAALVLGGESGADQISKITNNLVSASDDLAKTTHALRDRLTQGVLAPGGDLDRGMHGFADTAQKLSSLTGRLDVIISRTAGSMDEAGKSVLRSIENVEVVTTQVRDLVGRNKSGVDDTVGTITNAIKKVQDALGRFDKIMAHVEHVASDVDAGKGNVGRLLRDETLVRSSEQLLSSTSSLLKRYIDLEIGIDYKLAAHAVRAGEVGQLDWQSHLSLRLQPSQEKYVLLTLTANNLPVTRTTTRQTTFGQDQAPFTETLVESESVPRFGVQYARRFGSVVLRGGLIENTAGGGVDLDVVRDKLSISADLFRFRDLPRPRLRASLSWVFVPHLYAWLGGDELLFPSSRADLFFGLGLTFTDNDLFVLFTSAPSVSFK